MKKLNQLSWSWNFFYSRVPCNYCVFFAVLVMKKIEPFQSHFSKRKTFLWVSFSNYHAQIWRTIPIFEFPRSSFSFTLTFWVLSSPLRAWLTVLRFGLSTRVKNVKKIRKIKLESWKMEMKNPLGQWYSSPFICMTSKTEITKTVEKKINQLASRNDNHHKNTIRVKKPLRLAFHFSRKEIVEAKIDVYGVYVYGTLMGVINCTICYQRTEIFFESAYKLIVRLIVTAWVTSFETNDKSSSVFHFHFCTNL